MPKKSTEKKTIAEIDLEKKEIEDSEVEDSENESENEESENEKSDGEEEGEGEDTGEAKDSKDNTGKQIETFESIFSKITDLRTDILKTETKKNTLIKEHEISLKEYLDKIKKFKSEEKKLYEKIPKIHKTELAKASKEKRKRNKENKGGFNKEAPVPEVLREFLGLEKDVLLSRPSVMSKVNDKFKELGLKDGQKTILDKKTAKRFGLKSGHVIPFEGMQTFLKDQYSTQV